MRIKCDRCPLPALWQIKVSEKQVLNLCPACYDAYSTNPMNPRQIDRQVRKKISATAPSEN